MFSRLTVLCVLFSNLVHRRSCISKPQPTSVLPQIALRVKQQWLTGDFLHLFPRYNFSGHEARDFWSVWALLRPRTKEERRRGRRAQSRYRCSSHLAWLLISQAFSTCTESRQREMCRIRKAERSTTCEPFGIELRESGQPLTRNCYAPPMAIAVLNVRHPFKKILRINL